MDVVISPEYNNLSIIISGYRRILLQIIQHYLSHKIVQNQQEVGIRVLGLREKRCVT